MGENRPERLAIALMTQNSELKTDRPFRILVVEDDPEVARLLCLSLIRDGLECEVATEGMTALRMFEEKPSHLVLLDWMLPSMGGQEVLDALRAKSDVPVIVVSALADESTTAVFRGADGQIGKPFNPMRLLRRVRELLAERYES